MMLFSRIASFKLSRLLCPLSSRLPLSPCKHLPSCTRRIQLVCPESVSEPDTEERRSAAAYRARDALCWSWWMFSRAPSYTRVHGVRLESLILFQTPRAPMSFPKWTDSSVNNSACVRIRRFQGSTQACYFSPRVSLFVLFVHTISPISFTISFKVPSETLRNEKLKYQTHHSFQFRAFQFFDVSKNNFSGAKFEIMCHSIDLEQENWIFVIVKFAWY